MEGIRNSEIDNCRSGQMKREREGGSGGWRPAIHGGVREVKLIIERIFVSCSFCNGWMAQSAIG